jgi:hypothetical protein
MNRAAALLLLSVLAQSGVGALLMQESEERSYDVKLIRPGLRTDAKAVIRERSIVFEVTDSREASARVTEAYTIFRKDGRGFGYLELPYDRFRRIKNLKGALYDGQGSLVRSLEGDDIKDESDIDISSLYQDARIVKAELYHDRYPYTVQYSYRILYDGYLGWPTWAAQPSDEPVEQSRFEVVIPSSYRLRYRVSPDSALPKILPGDPARYVWETRNLPQLSQEDLEEDLECRTTVVQIAPGEFEIGGSRGDMSSWQSYGRWAASLYAGKDRLPEAAVKDVQAVVEKAGSVREKVDLLYGYMRSRTRYVSVQLGLGGWEPFDAAYVHQKGYGDCKALVNYMISLLHEAGIASNPALVYGGEYSSQVVQSFPSQAFNHVLVCVPLEKDTVWLECTSKTDPAGYLGDFTENRPALLLTPEGGILVRTPASSPAQNLCARRGRVLLYGGGGASAVMELTLTGNYADAARSSLTHTPLLEQEQWLLGNFQVSGAKLIGHTIEGLESCADRIDLKMRLEFPALASSTDTRLFLQPNLTDRTRTPPRDRKSRKSPVRLRFPRVCTDTIHYVLPEGFTREALPTPVTLDASFGSFRSSISVLGDTVILYVRNLTLKQTEIPPEHYQEYVHFFKEATRADRAQAVLVRK